MRRLFSLNLIIVHVFAFAFCLRYPLTMASPRELLDRYYYEGWNKADSSVMNSVLEENVKFQGALGKKSPKRGRQAFVEYMRSVHQVLGKHMRKIEDVIISENGSRAAVRVTCRGVHKSTFFGVEASGHEVFWTNAAFFTFSNNGRISEIWILGDVDHLKGQIGAGPDSSVFATNSSTLGSS